MTITKLKPACPVCLTLSEILKRMHEPTIRVQTEDDRNALYFEKEANALKEQLEDLKAELRGAREKVSLAGQLARELLLELRDETPIETARRAIEGFLSALDALSREGFTEPTVLRIQLENLGRELQAKTQRIVELEKTRRELSEEVEDYKRLEEKAQGTADQTATECERLEKELRALKTYRDDDNAKLEEILGPTPLLHLEPRGAMLDIPGRVKRLQEARLQLEGNLIVQANLIRERNNEIVDLKGVVERLTQDRDREAAEARALRRSCSELGLQLAGARDANTEAEKPTVANLQRKIERQRAAIAELEASKKALRDELRTALTTGDAEKLRNLQGILSRMREELAAVVAFGGQLPDTATLVSKACEQLVTHRKGNNDRGVLILELEKELARIRGELLENPTIFFHSEGKATFQLVKELRHNWESVVKKADDVEETLRRFHATQPSADRMKEVLEDRERIRQERNDALRQLAKIRSISGNESGGR